MRDGSLGREQFFINCYEVNYPLEHVFRQPGVPDTMIERDMEKTGEIKQGVTPSEDTGEKAASEEQLADHVTKRVSDTAQSAMAAQSPPVGGCSRPNCCKRSTS